MPRNKKGVLRHSLMIVTKQYLVGAESCLFLVSGYSGWLSHSMTVDPVDRNRTVDLAPTSLCGTCRSRVEAGVTTTMSCFSGAHAPQLMHTASRKITAASPSYLFVEKSHLHSSRVPRIRLRPLRLVRRLFETRLYFSHAVSPEMTHGQAPRFPRATHPGAF